MASRKKDLEAELERINARSERVLELSCGKKEMIEAGELRVSGLRAEVDTLENTPTITPAATEALATIRQNMEVVREELKNLKWKP